MKVATIQYECEPGDNVGICIRESINLAVEHKCVIEFIHNANIVRVSEESDPVFMEYLYYSNSHLLGRLESTTMCSKLIKVLAQSDLTTCDIEKLLLEDVWHIKSTKATIVRCIKRERDVNH